MTLPLAEFLLLLTGLYLTLGLVFAVPQLAGGLQRRDPQVRGSGVALRLLLLPGLVLLWPAFVRRRRRAS